MQSVEHMFFFKNSTHSPRRRPEKSDATSSKGQVRQGGWKDTGRQRLVEIVSEAQMCQIRR